MPPEILSAQAHILFLSEALNAQGRLFILDQLVITRRNLLCILLATIHITNRDALVVTPWRRYVSVARNCLGHIQNLACWSGGYLGIRDVAWFVSLHGVRVLP